IQSGNAESFVSIPWKRMRPPLLNIGKSDIAAITDDVNEKSVRDLALDLLHVKKMVRSAVCPAPNALLAGNFLHHDSQEIAAAAAFVQEPVADLLSVQSRDTKQLAAQPYFEQLLPVRRRAQHVIKKSCPRPRTAQHKNWRSIPLRCWQFRFTGRLSLGGRFYDCAHYSYLVPLHIPQSLRSAEALEHQPFFSNSRA